MGLQEKSLVYETEYELSWSPSLSLLKLDASGQLPLFIDEPVIISHHYPICEYLDEVYQDAGILMGENSLKRREVRRIMTVFDEGFYDDVFLSVFYEKIWKRAHEAKSPDAHRIKSGLDCLKNYMEYLDNLAEKSAFLVGKALSWADVTAAAHVSCLDYLGHIHWEHYAHAKEWYLKVKSRPSFRGFLGETIHHITPAPHYSILDF